MRDSGDSIDRLCWILQTCIQNMADLLGLFINVIL